MMASRNCPEALSRLPLAKNIRSTNGIALGVLLGVFAALWLFTPYRSAAISQLRFALSSDSLGWLQVLDARKSERELPRLDATASRHPEDYLLQVGRATASATFDNLASTERSNPTYENDRTLLRLAALPRAFPGSPGAFAHFIRYMTAAFVRVDSPDSLYRLKPSHRKFTLWAIENGEKLDPDNAYWAGMHLILLLADNRPQEAINLLEQFYQKSYWESFVYEEALGQWRLYAETYGDQGAIQKIAPLSLIAFPHLQQLRASAEKLRLIAEQEEHLGHPDKAIEIRRGLSRISHLLEGQSRWAYEALFGTEILRIAITDSSTEKSKSALTKKPFSGKWERKAEAYLALLTAHHREKEIARLRREMVNARELRDRIDQARYDASFPGIPPGIPLAALFNNWMAGVGLLRQSLSLILLTLLIRITAHPIWRRFRAFGRVFSLMLALFGFAFSGLLLSSTPESGPALFFVWSATLLLFLARILAENGTELEMEQEIRPVALISVYSVGLFFFLILFRETRPLLGSRHPVALLLNGALGVHPTPTPSEALSIATLTSGIAIAVIIVSLLFCVRRRVTIESVLRLFSRQMILPLLALLSLLHLFHLSYTINLDRLASRAINEATANDLSWVLTHGGSEDF